MCMNEWMNEWMNVRMSANVWGWHKTEEDKM